MFVLISIVYAARLYAFLSVEYSPTCFAQSITALDWLLILLLFLHKTIIPYFWFNYLKPTDIKRPGPEKK